MSKINLKQLRVGTHIKCKPDWVGSKINKEYEGKIAKIIELYDDRISLTIFFEEAEKLKLGHCGDMGATDTGHWNVTVYSDGRVSSTRDNKIKILNQSPIQRIEVKV